MILHEHGDQLVVIRQTDHGALSGFLAREWGNEVFRRPEPFEAFHLAAGEHDNGWREWELKPKLDPKTRLPYSFMSIPTEQHIALYQHGIDRVVQADHYAGLLTSLHCSGLYDRARATMPGFSAKYVKSSESQAVSEFLQRLKLQQLRLKSDLRANPVTRGFTEETALEKNMRLLEVLDRLSLYFCLGPLEDTTIEGVPLNSGDGDADCVLRCDESNGVTLSPYPFRRSPVAVSILVRQVPKRLYGDESDFQRTLARAPYSAMNFTLSREKAADQARSAVA